MILFRHNSRLLEFRRPYGAIAAGETVAVSAEIGGDEPAEALLRLWLPSGEALIPMAREGERLLARFDAPKEPCLLWYYFILRQSDGRTLYYGAESGEGAFYGHEPPAWQVTVYEPGFTTPAWLREGLAYQIFPDRFRRSSWEDFHARARYHTGLGRFLRLHDRWSEPVCDGPSPGQSDYMPDDFFGGDLNGIREKLPYLASLGVRLIYLNPVFESASNHRYDTADYLRIDPILGSEEDFRALAAEARALGIRVMLDGVFSHTGADSRYFDKFSRYEELGAFESPDSPCAGWYSFSDYPGTYACWWNFPALPNVDELHPGYRDFILGENGVLAHWAAAGATSWRLDVADELPDAFIRALRRRVKQLDPEAALIGEVWEDCSTKAGPEGWRGYVGGGSLDGAMNYPFADALIAFLCGKTGAHAFCDFLETQRERYPKPFYEACLNLVGSHDVVRAAPALSGAPPRPP
ncbi:MAG: glycoside hydrolase family 13 protein, partial [Clostridia bacterium]|nr:glycoside hydrolase family 13 protein [Clostridia bacterium]